MDIQKLIETAAEVRLILSIYILSMRLPHAKFPRMIRSVAKSVQSAVRDFVARLRDRFPQEIEAIRLYGSVARGSADKDSDVDILVLVKKKTDAIENVMIDLVCDIMNEYGVFIETVTITSSDYKKAVNDQYPFTINVERDAVEL